MKSTKNFIEWTSFKNFNYAARDADAAICTHGFFMLAIKNIFAYM